MNGTRQVLHLHAADVEKSFQTGAVLAKQPDFEVHASRRNEPGEAELHDLETDIFHILEGSASIIVGGTIDEQRRIAPHQHRGPGISDGQSIALRAGDVIIIPRGTPHWFQRIDDAPLVYYTVKVIEQI